MRSPEPSHHAADRAPLIEKELGQLWIPQIYRDRILNLRTRAYHFDHAKPTTRVSIQHTLLGVELKVGSKRLLCPDLATARYLSVFARLGCSDVAIPYDITKISHLADELESAWFRMLLVIERETQQNTERHRNRLLGLLIAGIRHEIIEAGAGTKIPAFKQSTKQQKA